MIESEGWEGQRVKPTLVDAVTNRLIYRGSGLASLWSNILPGEQTKGQRQGRKQDTRLRFKQRQKRTVGLSQARRSA